MSFKKSLLFLSISYFIISCANKVDPITTTSLLDASDAKSVLVSSNNALNLNIDEINNTKAMDALTSLQSLDIDLTLTPNPSNTSFGSRKAHTTIVNRDSLYNLLSKFVLKTITARYTTEHVKGTYNYNWDTYRFDFAGASDNISFNFPDHENRLLKSRVNNCTYTISTLETTSISISNTETDTVITKLTATLSVDASKELDLSYSATYNTSGILTSLSENATFSSYKISYSYTLGNTTGYSKSISLDDNSVFEASATKTLSSDTSLGTEKYKFSYKISDLVFSGTLDIKGLKQALASDSSKATIYTVTDTVIINKYYKTSLIQSTNNLLNIVGNVLFKPDTLTVCDANNVCTSKLRLKPYILYKDSTSEKLENRLQFLKKYWNL